MNVTVLRDVEGADRELLMQLTWKGLQGLFWNSIWQNGEAEEIARQTLNACRINLEQHNQPFSWLSRRALVSVPMQSVDNAHGLSLVIASEHLVIEDAPTGLTPPDNTHEKGGKPQVLRLTSKMLEYVRELT